MRATLALAMVAFLLTTALGQGIKKWRTPDGGLYFGDDPPEGSEPLGATEKLSTMMAAPPEDESAAGSEKEGDEGSRLSVTASLKRRDIERRLQKVAKQLAAVRIEIEYVKGVRIGGRPAVEPDAEFVADVADFQTSKKLTLEELQKKEREKLAEIRDLYGEFEALRAEVAKAHPEGNPPWWRDRVECNECPLPGEVEAALR